MLEYRSSTVLRWKRPPSVPAGFGCRIPPQPIQLGQGCRAISCEDKVGSMEKQPVRPGSFKSTQGASGNCQSSNLQAKTGKKTIDVSNSYAAAASFLNIFLTKRNYPLFAQVLFQNEIGLRKLRKVNKELKSFLMQLNRTHSFYPTLKLVRLD